MELEIMLDKEDLSEAFNISPEREKELATIMDEVFNKCSATSSLSYMLGQIASECNNNEELVWCTVVHTQFLIIKGILPINIQKTI